MDDFRWETETWLEDLPPNISLATHAPEWVLWGVYYPEVKLLRRGIQHDAWLTHNTATVFPTYTCSDVDLFLERETGELWVIVSSQVGVFTDPRKGIKNRKTLRKHGARKNDLSTFAFAFSYAAAHAGPKSGITGESTLKVGLNGCLYDSKR